MVAGPDSRLPVPNWPTPLNDEEFVRSMGMIRKRPKGGLSGWIAEEQYCDARRSLKLDQNSITASGLGKWNFRVAFRRFYFDGTAVAKFEIGFATDRKISHSDLDDLNKFLSALLLMPVRVGRPGRKALVSRLIESGKALAELYASASNKHRWNGWIGRLLARQRKSTSLVISGTPAVFIEMAPQQGISGILPDRLIEFATTDPDLGLYYWRNSINGRSFPVWTAVHPDFEKVAEIRKLRLYLLRLNAENQALVRVLKAINSDKINPPPRSAHSDLLQDYLNRATANIRDLSVKSRGFAVGNDKLVSLAAAAAEVFLSASERQSALQNLENLQIRKNVFRKLKDQETLEDLGSSLGLKDTQHSINIFAENVNIGGSMSKSQEKIVAVLFGTAFLITLLVIAIMFPQPTTFQYTIFRAILALAAAGFVSMTPGFIEVVLGKWLRAGGALGVFVVVYFFSPAALVLNP